MSREPFPLQWPDGWKRTHPHARVWSKFKVGFDDARKGMLHELELLGAANVVMTSDLPRRRDGQPYADGRAADPGIAVWFVLDGQERVFACDRWPSPAENVRAIELMVAALRGIERWGATDAVTRAFSGFAALPPGSSNTNDRANAKRPWRVVLANGTGASWPDGISNDELLVLAKARHRKLIVAAHPDRGGDPAIAAELNAALAEAEQELGR